MTRRRYYITPYRLTRNPLLWRSIGLLTTLKPDQDIFVPESTNQWLRSNWANISPENAVLCLKYAEYPREYSWSANIPVAEKILDLLMLDKENCSIPLSCMYTKEETLTKFLENDFKTLADKLIEAEAVVHNSWRGMPEVSQLSNWIDNISTNPSLKTYQLELIWKAVPKTFQASAHLIGRVKFEITPDYILQDYLSNLSVLEGRYSSSQYLFPLMKEAMRRGMLVESTPTAVTVPSQSRPVTFVKPILEEVAAV